MSDHAKVLLKAFNLIDGLTIDCPVCQTPMKVSGLFLHEDSVTLEFKDDLHTFTEQFRVVKAIGGGTKCLIPY